MKKSRFTEGQIMAVLRQAEGGADFDESGQSFRQVTDKHFAKSRTAGSIELRQPDCCYG